MRWATIVLMAFTLSGCGGLETFFPSVGLNVRASGNPLLVGMVDQATRPLANQCPGDPAVMQGRTSRRDTARDDGVRGMQHHAELERGHRCDYDYRPVDIGRPARRDVPAHSTGFQVTPVILTGPGQ